MIDPSAAPAIANQGEGKSGNSLSPLGVQNKEFGAASQTLQRRLKQHAQFSCLVLFFFA